MNCKIATEKAREGIEKIRTRRDMREVQRTGCYAGAQRRRRYFADIAAVRLQGDHENVGTGHAIGAERACREISA